MMELDMDLGLSIAALAVVSGAILPTIYRQTCQMRRRQEYWQLDLLYEDEDGTATKESQTHYSVRIQKYLILLGCISGIALAITDALTITCNHSLSTATCLWLFSVIWILLTFQGIHIFMERRCTYIFAYSAHLLWLAAMTGTSICVLLLLKFYKAPGKYAIGNKLAFAQFAATILICVATMSIPRRPDVYNKNGELIDRMRGVSIYSRYSYTWAAPILRTAARKCQMDDKDFPKLDARRRADYLEQAFAKISKSPELLVTLMRAHKKALLLQLFLTFLVSISTFAPQLLLYKILSVLEARNAGIDIGYQAWIWVIGLGLMKVFDAVIQALLYWMSFSELDITIRSQLSAAIFRKTLRKKDIKGSRNTEDRESGLDKGEGEEADELKNMKQGTINLLAIDTTRISEVAGYAAVFAESLFGLIIGFGSLIVIIGWKSLLAGLSIILVIAPINVLISKRYASAQDKLMKIRDKKMAAVSEALQGIRQIKFSALEKQWEQRIFDVRQEELNTLKQVFINDTLLIACWIANPVLLSVFALSVHAYINGALLPSTAFTALAIFGELEFVLSVVPELTTDLLDAVVSSKRIKDYLDSAERTVDAKTSDTIAIRNASIAWPVDDNEEEEDRFVLRGVNIEFPMNELSLISGRTGSGKSLLLACLLGEADILEGHVELPKPVDRSERYDSKATPADWILPSNVAYVAQIPWMENASIRDNILFGLPYDEQRYKKTLFACALEQDLSVLTDGEFTEIGANGINLSGGQRWRVSFARALYSRAGILILDDIFSAVDAHVGRHLFEEGLCGELSIGRTRILVTHHMKLCLPKAQYTVLLGDGIVAHAGPAVEFQNKSELKDMIENEDETINENDLIELELERVNSASSGMQRRQSLHATAVQETPTQPPRKFVTIEERERGAVKRQIYWAFMKASGGIPWWMLICIAFIVQELLLLGRSWLVKMWTNSYEEKGITGHFLSLAQYTFHKAQDISKTFYIAQAEKSVGYWIGMYATLSMIVCVLGASRYYLVFHASLRASKDLFQSLTKTVLRAPLRWLDTVPTGRVLNRFSKDFETIDSRVANDVAYLIYNALGLLGIILAGVVVSPYMFIVAAFMLLISILYAWYYLAGAREAKRLESNSRSPIFEFFGSTLTGVATIRAFGKVEEYIEHMFEKIDNYGKCTFYVWLFNRWVGFRNSMVGAFFAFIVAAVVISLPNTDASLAGFALSFAMAYTGNVIWAIRRYANVELDMNSTERIVEYIKLETEPQDGFHPSAAWPTEGKIEVRDLVVSYASDLPPVLKGVSFTVEPRQRLGVVGRTGAGKSSLTLALFQFIQVRDGKIIIDGLDTQGINLYDLRSRMAIIPQDPVLFSGTVRSNLDPFGERTDEELREALQRVHLIPSSSSSSSSPIPSSSASASGTSTPQQQKNTNIFTSLSSSISEGGLNLSQGQRQLLCLARAIVSKPKILVMDEATSAVDMHTESLIRKSMEEEFKDCTTIVIAHRLATVVGYDRILVLGEGKVVEWGSPWELLNKRGGVFREMVKESGEEEALRGVAREAAGILVEE